MGKIDQTIAAPRHPSGCHPVEEILPHPKFPLARAEFIDAVLALYEGDALLTRLMVEAARQVTFSAILNLDASRDPHDPATWPTLARLKRELVQYGLSSARRIEGLVALLVHNGYLETSLAPHDRRLRILTPTAKMRATDQNWWQVQFVPLQAMFPNPGYGEVMRRDPAFHRALRQVATTFFGRGAEILGGNPDMMLFLQRDAGVLILLKLAQMAGAPDGPAVNPDYRSMAARFGVSRTHVQKVLQDAAGAGLVSKVGRSGAGVLLKPAIWRALDRFIAESMAGNDMLFSMAKTQMKANEGVH